MLKRTVGLAYIAAVVFLWVLSSELIQFIFDSALSFESPLFLTFYSTSLFSLYLIGFLICPSWRAGAAGDPDAPADGMGVHEDEDSGHGEDVEEPLLQSSERTEDEGALPSTATHVSVAETARTASLLAPLWLLANWAYNASLCRSCGTGTSVSNCTLLSSSSSVFTVIFSIIFLGDAFSVLKLACAALNLGGVALLVYDGRHTETPTITGDLLAVLSAACMAAYTVQLKHLLSPQTATAPAVSMPMLFGFLGVAAAILCLPLFLAAIVLGYPGWANLELLRQLVAQPRILQALTLNGLFGTVLSDLVWARAVVLTSPLVTSVGVGFTIPLAFLADYVREAGDAEPLGFEYFAGAVMIVVSFAMVNVLESRPREPTVNVLESRQSREQSTGTDLHTDTEPAMYSELAQEVLD